MAQELFHNMEPYLPGMSFVFGRLDEHEANRLIRRATEIPVQIACMVYGDEGEISGAQVFTPFNEKEEPNAPIRLRQAIFAMTHADDIVISDVRSED